MLKMNIVINMWYMSLICSDVKPANIMLDKHGNCKLGDFGLDTLEVFEGQKVEGRCGTPAYMAPEVIISFCFKLILLYFLQ